ncbi:hypothetical protein, partial [Xanthomonas sp. SHU 166]|uniref:hypothetical protein n=1 Tax=Xanthomonas sp. SHU 166 TaxID=1591170 RepID=UPI001E51F6E4
MSVVAADPERVSAEGALRGVLSFGYFSLHKQRKVTRRQAKAVAVDRFFSVGRKELVGAASAATDASSPP